VQGAADVQVGSNGDAAATGGGVLSIRAHFSPRLAVAGGRPTRTAGPVTQMP
jgi:hypothetical protein